MLAEGSQEAPSLRAFLIEEKRISRSFQSLRVPHGIDSQVTIGSVVKRRTASKALNQELRRSMCWPIGSDIYNGCMYFESKRNRADAPTRHAEPPKPDIELPSWWLSSAGGDHAELDRWLLDVAAPDVTSGLPLDEISGADYEALKPQSRVRKDIAERGDIHKPKSKSVKDYPLEHEGIDIVPGVFSSEAVDILKKFHVRQFSFGEGHRSISCKGGLDLYSGCFGVAKAMLKAGAPWILSFEIKRSCTEDLLDVSLQKDLLRLIELRVFGTVFCAPICSSFSVAITPPVRSRRHPRGIPGLRRSMRVKVRQGNQHSDFVIDVIDAPRRPVASTELKTQIPPGCGGKGSGDGFILMTIRMCSAAAFVGSGPRGRSLHASPLTASCVVAKCGALAPVSTSNCVACILQGKSHGRRWPSHTRGV